MEDNRKDIVDKLTLGILKTLEKRKGVCEVKLTETKGCDEDLIAAWEQKHACIMCNDLKNFYLSMNGVKLTYKVKIREHTGINQPASCIPSESRVPVGRIAINCIEKFCRISSFTTWSAGKQCSAADIVLDDDSEDEDILKPSFDHRSRIFELECLDGHGKVCYVFLDTKPGIPATRAEIWFVDRALRWHHLADSFVDYYRLAIMHLGLPQWQYRFTEVGLTPQSKQWFELFCPKRLHEQTSMASKQRYPLNCLEPSKIFKSRKDARKSTSAMNEKMTTVKSRKNLGSANRLNSSQTKLNSSSNNKK